MSTKSELEQEHYTRIGLLMALGGSGLIWITIIMALSI